MDRLNQLRGAAGSSGDSTLDTTSPPSEAYMTANDNSKYFSLSEVDSTFDIAHMKEVPLTTTKTDTAITSTDVIIPNLSPIHKKNDHETYNIGKQIEAANILSGGVQIFDDNDNSYDGDELVIDDNVEQDEKSDAKTIEEYKSGENLTETATLVQEEPGKDTEVVLQIDGKNVDAIDIGNGLYLYRKEGEEELAAVQIIDDNQQQPSFKFLKVRENAEGNLEVYEEFEIEVPKEVPSKDGKSSQKNTTHMPINQDINKIINDSTSNKVAEKITPAKEIPATATFHDVNTENKQTDKPELNLNGKMMKFNETRKSPVVGSFMPMTHSTPNKEGIPLTKTMVDQQLHPSRHSDNVKKTIEVHTENCKKLVETPTKNKEVEDVSNEPNESLNTDVKDDNHDNEEKIEPKITLSENEVSNLTNEDKTKTIEDKNVEVVKINETNEEKSKVSENPKAELAKEQISSTSTEKETIKPLTIVDNIEKTEKLVLQPADTIPAKEIEVKENEKISLIPATTQSKADEIKEEEKINITEEVQDIKNTEEKPKKSEDIKPIKEVSKSSEDVSTELPNTVNKSEEKTQVTKDNKDEIIAPINEITDKKIDINVSLADSSKTYESLNVSEDNSKIADSGDSDSVSGAKSEVAKDNEGLNLSKESNDKTEDVKKLNNEEEVLDLKSTETATKCEKIIVDSEKPKEEESKSEQSVVVDSTKECKDDKIDEIKDCKEVPKDKDNITETLNTVQKSEDDAKDKGKDLKIEDKPINNNNSAVPFGKWTEANRQAFLNKIKETKTPVYNNSSKSIKNSNDLNKRDVLKKIDSQRQTTNANTKNVELNKPVVKNETLFISKTTIAKQESKTCPTNSCKIPVKSVTSEPVSKKITVKKISKPESQTKAEVPSKKPAPLVLKSVPKETSSRKVNAQDLIDKTIEEMINRTYPKRTSTEDNRTSTITSKDQEELDCTVADAIAYNQDKFDAIELKMSELHGMKLTEKQKEQPQNISPKLNLTDKSENKKPSDEECEVPNLTTTASLRETLELDSEEEIIEHEPVTGDIETTKTESPQPIVKKDEVQGQKSKQEANKAAIITEKDFDKFVRRNSVTYENHLTVSVPETQAVPANYSNKTSQIPLKLSAKIQNYKHNPSNKVTILSNIPINEDSSNKNYQSKLQLAYQNALTVKRKMEGPITIIEDKPVKVVFMDANSEFTPSQLNVQGKDLSPSKMTGDNDNSTISSSDSFDFDVVDASETKTQDESKNKIKHQRKQVLTPVEEPEFELIRPTDLGIDVSSKKKRRVEETKQEKTSTKNLIHKKSYLLGRSVNREEKVNGQNVSKDTVNKEVEFTNKTTVSAIDNLVKAAELLENQLEDKESKVSNNDSPQQTPTKRGRGRPRKYPLSDGSPEKPKTPSPQKKPRLIDAKPVKHDTTTEEDTSDDEIVKENWTMGKINENIVCPICNKLFRTENVVFKHVKHCTGPSPNRSDAGKRRSRRMRDSQDSDSKSFDSQSDLVDDDEDDDDIKISEIKKTIPKKRKSVDNKIEAEKDDVIVIEDTPIKEKPKEDNRKHHESRKETRNTSSNKSLECEHCGKTFRQLSYLDSHRLLHRKQGEKKIETVQSTEKSVFGCEVCKKEFRKLHHLVQHRIIHNSNTNTKASRKTSSEQNEIKNETEEVTKQSEDTSAGFRCEPCDKSFRKLHHLVEHRETHDGINRQKTTATNPPSNVIEKSPPPPQCEICKKTFRKLHHLIEHKEQHNETNSEKSDDKSVQSSLSTKDIIHECSLCYMVFPNEHSLNKHTVICQRKKKSKLAKPATGDANDVTENTDHVPTESSVDDDDDDEPKIVAEEIKIIDLEKDDVEDNVICLQPTKEMDKNERATSESLPESDKSKVKEIGAIVKQSDVPVIAKSEPVLPKDAPKLKKSEEKEIPIAEIKTKVAPKEKVEAPVIRKQKVTKSAEPVAQEIKPKPAIESSDDEEIRYMLNPDYKVETPGKMFMKVRANKRSSLQIERPDSKELVKRRTSLQHPPKIPRLKPKPVDVKPITNIKRRITKIPEVLPATDSDDSDVKYSFPTAENTVKAEQEPAKKISKPQRKSITEKRKTLSSIAKRKSLGKAAITTHKPSPLPVKQFKKRITEVEHRCDCGQLFSSAALLSRHTTLAHTPPRIRKRRSPPPEADTKPIKQTRKSIEKLKPVQPARKSSARSDASASSKPIPTRKTSVKVETKPTEVRKSIKSESSKPTVVKAKRAAAHRGVPVPEKMRKLFQKSKS